MSDEKKSKRGQADGARPQSRKPSAGDKPGGGQADRDVGHALRSVYSKTVNEEIPSELLDLLGKLS